MSITLRVIKLEPRVTRKGSASKFEVKFRVKELTATLKAIAKVMKNKILNSREENL